MGGASTAYLGNLLQFLTTLTAYHLYTNSLCCSFKSAKNWEKHDCSKANTEGWYVVWQLFLSKFKFLRELIGDTGSQQGDNEPSETETEQETPPSPQRGRQKSARQRRAATGETT
ncbi:PREDICTED: small integral membrane protein 13 [Ficedula albicollis]|uniref:small integral membrane protein 13 n=1 Tax=Ficedula albicollis TaxID=59894 RepID=UPI000359D9D0|nr:PREDICTED: small integral membrane protein 13 [Ficedula albicollis]